MVSIITARCYKMTFIVINCTHIIFLHWSFSTWHQAAWHCDRKYQCRSTVFLSKCGFVPSTKLGPVCLSRPDQSWHSGHYEGLVLQCKDTAMVRPLPTPKTSRSSLRPSLLCASAALLLLLIKVPDLRSCWTDRKSKERKKCVASTHGVHTSKSFYLGTFEHNL